MTHPSTVADTLDAGPVFGVWQDIAGAPRDGTGMLLTDGRWVHYGWWRGEGSHPWVMVDSHDTDPHGCCDNEAVDTIQLNGWAVDGPTRWMPIPDLPAKARGEVQP